MLRSVHLVDLRLLGVSGPERVPFLQGQLTQDVTTLLPGHTALAGWADPKGRLLFAGHVFALTAGEDQIALLVPAGLAPALEKRLRMYVLRARVQVTVLDVALVGLPGAAAPAPDGERLTLEGAAGRQLLVAPAGAPPRGGADPEASDAWQLDDVRQGLPVVLPPTSGEFVPQMLNLDLLGGISFNKGCYTGQEIVARMKYRGRVTRRMLRFAASGPPPLPGAPVYGGRGVAGKVVRAAADGNGCEFLAVIVLNDLPGPLHLDEAGSRPVRRLDLPYDVPVEPGAA